ncbi:unnamed protein product [Meloidogyne enterolobii]|uniref:Uncharacterized protein n=1 Tax=Meloidogyne enterolobii TaxID=390850 RepID=A0ACB0ZBM1_MELEN
MAEEGLTNSDLELKLNQSNELIKLQTNFNELQLKFNEEKEKTLNLENELKEMKEKNRKLESGYKNEIEQVNNIAEFNSKYTLNFKKINNLFENKFADLAIKFEQLNNVTCKVVNFVEIKNRWKIIAGKYIESCENNCINTDNPIGNCIEGNGFINLIGRNVESGVVAENSFKKPENCLNYSLFYVEIKCKMERELNNCLNWMVIGVVNNTKIYKFNSKKCAIMNEKNEGFKLSTFSWNDNDVFGCGLVYPPTNKITEAFPYIFFTQNGKQIGKALLSKDNFDCYQPYVVLRCCSVETNFGNNLETKPFIYDISKHFVLKEFY